MRKTAELKTLQDLQPDGRPPDGQPPPLQGEPLHKRIARLGRQLQGATETSQVFNKEWAEKNVKAQACRLAISTPELTFAANKRRECSRCLAHITRIGIEADQIRCKGEASAIIDLLEKRRGLGLATFRQARLMRRLGHPRPHEATFAEASAWIDSRLRRNS